MLSVASERISVEQLLEQNTSSEEPPKNTVKEESERKPANKPTEGEKSLKHQSQASLKVEPIAQEKLELVTVSTKPEKHTGNTSEQPKQTLIESEVKDKVRAEVEPLESVQEQEIVKSAKENTNLQKNSIQQFGQETFETTTTENKENASSTIQV